MKNNFKVFMVFVFVCLFSFMFLGTVKADYSEGTFGNEECISDMTFLNTAKSDYTFDKTTGVFAVSGKTAQEYRTASTAQDIKLAFYEVSSDGKTITAYVPSYTSAISSDYTKSLLEGLGISSSYNCDNVIKVTKTSTSGSSDVTPTNPTCGDGYVYDSTVKKCVVSNSTVDKMESPNTASPASIAAVIVGCALVVFAVYFYLKKSNVKKTN